MSNFKHRFFDKIESEIIQGSNQLYLHGKNVYRDYIYNPVIGMLSVSDSLCFNLIVKNYVEEVLIISNNGYKLITVNNLELQTNSLTIEEVNEKYEIPDNDFDKENDDLNLYMFRTISKIYSFYQNDFTVIVEGLDWLANIHEEVSPYGTAILYEIFSWRTQSNYQFNQYSIITLNSIEHLHNYFSIDLNNNELINIPNPNYEEIEQVCTKLFNHEINAKLLRKVINILRKGKIPLKKMVFILKYVFKTQNNILEDDSIINMISTMLKTVPDEEIKWDNIILSSDIKLSLQNTLNVFEASLVSSKLGPKGLLLYGEPGTGKTLIAKALAYENNYFFISAKLADIKGEYLGQSAKNVKEIFQEARENAPSIIFIDEIDAILSKRGNNSTDVYQEEIVNQFLSELDGINSTKQNIFLVGATNRFDLLDSAILSRLEKINIPLPDKKNRTHLIKSFLKEHNLNSSFVKDFISKTNFLSGRDIKNLISKYSQFISQGISHDNSINRSFRELKMNKINELSKPFFQVITFEKNKNENLSFFNIERKYIKTQIDHILNFDSIKKIDNNIQPLNGLLFYGEPGNGKTYLVHSIAKEYNLDIVNISSHFLFEETFSETIKNINHLIKLINYLSSIEKIVIFFDEIDSLFEYSSNSTFRSSVIELISTLHDNEYVVLVAATNTPLNKLDSALIRDNRFDYKIHMKYPNKNEIESLINYFCKGENIVLNQLDIKKLSNKFKENKYSLSSIKRSCNLAKITALNQINNNSIILLNEHFN